MNTAILLALTMTAQFHVGDPVVFVDSDPYSQSHAENIRVYSHINFAIGETSDYPETILAKADRYVPHGTTGILKERFASVRGFYLDTVTLAGGTIVVVPERWLRAKKAWDQEQRQLQQQRDALARADLNRRRAEQARKEQLHTVQASGDPKAQAQAERAELVTKQKRNPYLVSKSHRR